MRTISEAMQAEESKMSKEENQIPKEEKVTTIPEPNEADTVKPENLEDKKDQETELDIVERVSRIKDSIVDETQDDTKFNVLDIDKIEDPVAREQAQKAYKSFEKGFQKKFQELAEERKRLESEKESITKWTPEKIQSLLTNEEFIRASQQVVQTQNPTNGEFTDEEWSSLSDTEKTQFKLLQDKVSNMEHENQLAKMKAELSRQDAELQTKYSDYDANKVNQLRNDMLEGKVQATNEHLYKVLNYESAIKRAYKMGLEDRKTELGDKVNASTEIDTLGRTIPTSSIKREEGESAQNYLKRIIATKMQNKK